MVHDRSLLLRYQATRRFSLLAFNAFDTAVMTVTQLGAV